MIACDLLGCDIESPTLDCRILLLLTFLGVTILFNKPKKKDPQLFSFLSPLSFTVWIYMISAYIGVSMFLYLLAKISPYEKGNFSFLEPPLPPDGAGIG